MSRFGYTCYISVPKNGTKGQNGTRARVKGNGTLSRSRFPSRFARPVSRFDSGVDA